MIGSTMAMDLTADGGLDVTVVDSRPASLARIGQKYGVKTQEADLGNPAAVGRAVAGFDVALGALPSRIGLQTLRAVIEARVPYCDISFMAEDATELSPLARERGVTCVVDCGVAPGISNMMTGHAAAQMSRVERVDICVGGLPVERRWPYDYKAPFAPHDVIEEYTRPSRLVEHGRVVVREALSEPELIDFAGVGTLEAFNTDGLRSLLNTIDAPFMRERTLRYPGHIELMRAFRATGLFSKEPIEVDGARVRPLDVTAALLFPKWTFDEGEADLTAMQVVVDGVRDGARVRYRWQLLDHYDRVTATRSMSRTTAFPATIVARMLAEGSFPLGPGVHPPEVPAREAGFLDAVLAALAKRGVTCQSAIEPLPVD